jgi:hypothetical protein
MNDLVDAPTSQAVQVVFLTGQSDASRCALSPVQGAFLDALPLPASAKLPLNFPYHADTAPWRKVSLLAASINNARQYRASRRPDFAARHAPQVLRQLARAPRTLILAGSAGLELLATLRLPRDVLDRVYVFAYGPVARQRPDCACLLVQGRRDWVSRWWFRTVDHRVDCTHLDYLESPEVLALCVQTLQALTARNSCGLLEAATPRLSTTETATLPLPATETATPRLPTTRFTAS